jgi:hypothetical protein
VVLADSDEALGAEPVVLEAVPDVALEEPVDSACILLVHRSAPKYKRVIDMQAIGEQASRQHFQDEFRKALRDALRTAGRLESATREQRVADWRTRAFR